MLDSKKIVASFLFFTLFCGFTSCKVFKQEKCDRCPEFTEVDTASDEICEEDTLSFINNYWATYTI